MTGGVVVVGGGIAGAFGAWFLARAGIQATVIDRDRDLGTASLHNPGGLNPLHGPGIPGPLASFAMACFRLHEEHRGAIGELSGVDAAFRRVRRLSLAVDGPDLADREEVTSRYEAAQGFEAQWLDGDELRREVPGLGPAVAGGLMTWGNGRVEPGAATKAVRLAGEPTRRPAAGRGSARGLPAGDRATRVLTDEGSIPCDAVVIATGAWSIGPAGWLGIPLPVRRVQGELLRMRLKGEPFGCDLSWRSAAFYELTDGEVLVGGTELRAGDEARPTGEARRSILEQARRIVPSVADGRVVGHEAGLRPATPDDLPILGRAPGWDNVFLAMGGGRKGMLLASGMGMAIASLVEGTDPLLDIAAFSPGRFAASEVPAVAAGSRR